MSSASAFGFRWPFVVADVCERLQGALKRVIGHVAKFSGCVRAQNARARARSARDNELKGRDTATRVFSGDQEAHRERPETDGLVGRIDA